MRVLALAWAELRRLVSDTGAVTVLVAGTLFYAFFYPSPYSQQVTDDVAVAVVDLDNTGSSRALIRDVDATPQVGVRLVTGNLDEARSLLREGQVLGVLLVPEHFERDVLRGRSTRIGAFGNAAFVLVYSQVANGVVAAAGTWGALVQAQRELAAGGDAVQARAAAAPVQTVTRELYNPGTGYGTYIVPAVLILILQQTLLIGVGMTTAGTRAFETPRDGALVRLAGRSLAYLAVDMGLLVLLFIGVFWLYGLPRQAGLGDVALFLLPLMLAVIFVGICIGEWLRQPETVLQAVLMLSIPMLFLSGFAWPLESMPEALVWLGRLVPATHGIDGFVRMNQMGASLPEVARQSAWLWGLAGIYGGMAWWLLRRAMHVGAGRVPG